MVVIILNQDLVDLATTLVSEKKILVQIIQAGVLVRNE